MRKNTFITFEPRIAVFINGIVKVSKKKVVLDALEVSAPCTKRFVVVVCRETFKFVMFAAVETLRVAILATGTMSFGAVSAFDA